GPDTPRPARSGSAPAGSPRWRPPREHGAGAYERASGLLVRRIRTRARAAHPGALDGGTGVVPPRPVVDRLDIAKVPPSDQALLHQPFEYSAAGALTHVQLGRERQHGFAQGGNRLDKHPDPALVVRRPISPHHFRPPAA